MLVPLARDHERFVPEPQCGMPAQHLAGCLEVAIAGHCLGQALIVNLRDIGGSIPRGEQRRGSDRSPRESISSGSVCMS